MPQKLTQEGCIEKLQNVYGNKYDLSKVKYKNSSTKITLICHEKDEYGREHGEFQVRPSDAFMGKSGCRKCSGNYHYKDIKEFANEYFVKYTEKTGIYDIDLNQEYKNNKTKIKVTCLKHDTCYGKHGDFWTRPNDLMSGYGCPKCSYNYPKTTEMFKRQIEEVHGKEYKILSEYKSAVEKIKVKCSNGHIFYPRAANFLKGTKCPYCNCGRKSKVEEETYQLLIDANLNVIREKHFKWLKYKGELSLDFYLPDYNIAVEYQGEQHYVPIEHFGGIEEFNLRVVRDKEKKRLCENHGVKLFYIRGKKPNIDEILDYINETANKKTDKE